MPKLDPTIALKWRDEIMIRLKAKSWMVWLILFVLLFFVEEIIRNHFVSGAEFLGTLVWGQVKTIATGPLGYMGLAIGLWIMTLLTVALLAAIKGGVVSAPKAIAAPALGLEEKHEVQQVRTFWNEYGHRAPAILANMLSTLRTELSMADNFAELIDDSDLKQKAEALSGAVAHNNVVKHEDVQARLVELYVSYQRAAKWVVRLRERLSVGPSAFVLEPNQLEAWSKHAKIFREKLNELCNRTANLGLKVYPGDLLEPAVRAFILGEVPPVDAPTLARIRAATPDERMFLALFALETLPDWSAGQRLSHSVHQGGLSLKRDGVVDESDLGGYRRRFSLSETTLAVWRRAGFSEPPVRNEFEIGLDTVDGTGASGGGARGSDR